MKGPILARTTLQREVRPGTVWSMDLKVYGGLHYIKGNPLPMFSLTCEEHHVGAAREGWSGGADHATIVAEFPQFADLAAMHLSDIDGVPLHAEANGWHWLAGARGGLGEEFHGSNGASAKTREECMAIFAKHIRVSLDEARSLVERIAHSTNPATMRLRWKAEVAAMRPRWKAEAVACIAKHKLVVYGDPWTAPGAGNA